jgi:hypothetical protein
VIYDAILLDCWMSKITVTLQKRVPATIILCHRWWPSLCTQSLPLSAICCTPSERVNHEVTQWSGCRCTYVANGSIKLCREKKELVLVLALVSRPTLVSQRNAFPSVSSPVPDHIQLPMKCTSVWKVIFEYRSPWTISPTTTTFLSAKTRAHNFVSNMQDPLIFW